jgi:DeoR/GlpR family transcriptional regulator of sugar metabolism
LDYPRGSEKVADASKWERPGIIRFAEWNEIDDWITDKPLTVKETKKLRSFGLSLHVSRGWKHL